MKVTDLLKKLGPLNIEGGLAVGSNWLYFLTTGVGVIWAVLTYLGFDMPGVGCPE